MTINWKAVTFTGPKKKKIRRRKNQTPPVDVTSLMGSKERPFPSQEDILEFIRKSPKRVGRREIARAFRLGADHRLQLKKVLAEMKANGSLRTRWRRRSKLPAVTMLRITGDDDGDLLAQPEIIVRRECLGFPSFIVSPRQREAHMTTVMRGRRFDDPGLQVRFKDG